METILQRARHNLSLVNCIGTVEKFPEFISDAQDLVARIDGKAALNTFYANTSVSSMKDHDAIRNRIIQETDQAFFELINPLIKIDEELWAQY